MSDSLWPHESQHARPPCPSPTPRVHSNSHPSSWWCHPAISASVIPFSSCLQTLQPSESFLMSQLFTWGSQSTGVSALASFLPKNTQDWFPLESLFQHHTSKASILQCSAFFIGEGNDTPLQYSCLENPMDGGAWWASARGVAKSRNTTERLHFHFSLSCIGEGNGNPLQCSCLENPRDGGSLMGCHLWGCTESNTTEAT